VTLKNIHVLNLEAFEAGLDRIEDVLTSGGGGVGNGWIINLFEKAHLPRKAVAVDITFRIGVLYVNLGRGFSNHIVNLQNQNPEQIGA